MEATTSTAIPNHIETVAKASHNNFKCLNNISTATKYNTKSKRSSKQVSKQVNIEMDKECKSAEEAEEE